MPDNPPFDHPQHFTDLDGLRGILALSVVFLHYGINATMARLSHGVLPGFKFQLSVDFFFVLSGFVLAYSMRHDTPTVRVFAIKRIFRLVPVHYVCLAALLIVSALATGPLPYLPRPLPWSVIIADLALMTPIVLGTDAVNVPSWSVGWELYLPILAVALARFIMPVVRRFGVLIIVAGCCVMSWAAFRVASGDQLYGLRAACGLATGGCLFAVSRQYVVPPRLATPAMFYAMIAAMLGIMLFSASSPRVAVLFPWLAVAAVLVGTRTRTLLSSPPIAWLGKISYTLYMVHVPVLVAMALVVGARISGSFVLKSLAIVIALAVASLLTIVIEQPGMQLGRRFRATASRAEPHVV